MLPTTWTLRIVSPNSSGAWKLAEPCANADDALDLVGRLLEEVENEFSGVPYNPSTPTNDGRMYPPRADSRRKIDQPDMRLYRTRGHRLFISETGAILIQELNGTCVFSKVDKNGAQLRL